MIQFTGQLNTAQYIRDYLYSRGWLHDFNISKCLPTDEAAKVQEKREFMFADEWENFLGDGHILYE